MNEEIKNLIIRLKQKSITDSLSGCWLWQEYLDEKGYGRTKYKNSSIRVHRLSAHIFLFLDLNNKEQHALHKIECLNRNCWNPEHLYIGTNEDNVMDRVFSGHSKDGLGRQPATHCKNGHELNEFNVYHNKSGTKSCKICKLDYSRKQYENKLKIGRR